MNRTQCKYLMHVLVAACRLVMGASHCVCVCVRTGYRPESITWMWPLKRKRQCIMEVFRTRQRRRFRNFRKWNTKKKSLQNKQKAIFMLNAEIGIEIDVLCSLHAGRSDSRARTVVVAFDVECRVLLVCVHCVCTLCIWNWLHQSESEIARAFGRSRARSFSLLIPIR